MELRAERGFVLLASMLILVLMAGMLGLLADTANLQYARQRVQTAADGAAIGALYELRKGNTDGMLRAARGDAERNGAAHDANVEVRCPPRSGAYAADTAVEASVVERSPTLFLRLFGQGAVTVGARAVAVGGAYGGVTLGE